MSFYYYMQHRLFGDGSFIGIRLPTISNLCLGLSLSDLAQAQPLQKRRKFGKVFFMDCKYSGSVVDHPVYTQPFTHSDPETILVVEKTGGDSYIRKFDLKWQGFSFEEVPNRERIEKQLGPLQPGESLWYFNCGGWEALAGRSGYVVLHDWKIRRFLRTRMS